VTGLFWNHFFALLLLAIALAEWLCATRLLASIGGLRLPAEAHLLGPALIYAFNRRILSRVQPTSPRSRRLRQAYTAFAFTSVFGLLFLALTGLLWSVVWAGLQAIELAGLSLSVEPVSRMADLLATGGLLSIGGAMAYGYGLGQRKVWVNRFEVPMPGLASSMDGLRLIQISDIHLGGFTPVSTLARYVEQVNQLEPDLVVITGDITDGVAHAAETFPVLGQLRGRLGVVAILGNHDVYSGASAVRKLLGHYTGIRVLVDENLRVDDSDGSLWIVGLLDRGRDWARGLTECRIFEGLYRELPAGAPAVVLSHRPDLFDQAARLGAPLVLSGHTHGGQLAIPWRRGRALTLARFMTRYPRGSYRQGKSLLHVNLGLGVTGQPVRVATPREITEITLRRSAPSTGGH
jgi:predicted MPP superfamily phosphohydrolase